MGRCAKIEIFGQDGGGEQTCFINFWLYHFLMYWSSKLILGVLWDGS